MQTLFKRKLVAALATIAAIAMPAHAEPAIWTLSDEDTTISIVGTVHHLPENLNWRDGGIGEAFDAAHTVCFELDANARAFEAHKMRVRRGFFRPGDYLSDHLTNRQVKELKQTARALDIPFKTLNLMKPWLASLTLDDAFIGQLGLGDGVEFSLYPEVFETGKELCELETLEEQIGEWTKMNIDDQIRGLFVDYPGTEGMNARQALKFSEAQLDQLITNWVNGDVEAIGELVNTEASLNEPFHDVLLLKRNERWVPRITAMLETDGHIMIAVGAAHLAGDNSVIKMLRARGYKVDGP